jgi:hypothetical protein
MNKFWFVPVVSNPTQALRSIGVNPSSPWGDQYDEYTFPSPLSRVRHKTNRSPNHSDPSNAPSRECVSAVPRNRGKSKMGGSVT